MHPGSHSNQNVAYQPLTTRSSPKMTRTIGDSGLFYEASLDEEEETNCEEEILFALNDESTQRQRAKTHHQAIRSGTPTATCRVTLYGLRVALLVVATLLFLTFLAQLMTNHDHSGERRLRMASNQADKYSGYNQSSSARYHTSPDASTSTDGSRDHLSEDAIGMSLSGRSIKHDQQPKYETYLSSLVRDHGSALTDPTAKQDDITYPTEEAAQNTTSHHDNWWKLKFRLDKQYVVLENYVRAMKSFNENSSISLTTQATTDFIYHTIELCKRWDGPISVAVFTPGIELTIALTMIKFMRQCLPEPLSACIRDKVTWHLVYPSEHGPPAGAISFPRFHMDERHYALFIQTGHCPKLNTGPNDVDLVKQFEVELRKQNQIFPQNYRQKFHLVYPINVLRNTARLTAHTKHVLASDIELYPSADLVPKFMRLMENHDLSQEFPHLQDSSSRLIFALPIFELKVNVTKWPRTKGDIVKMMATGDAIFFHKWVCDACQNFPNRLRWLETDTLRSNRNHKSYNEEDLKVFEATRRDKSREFWEPIFIGTNKEPEYDDRLSWDGRRDKMGQMYEMCLQDYQILVLGNAFLFHAPGIKHLDKKDFNSRIDYIRQNNAIYDQRIAELRERYKLSKNIEVC